MNNSNQGEISKKKWKWKNKDRKDSWTRSKFIKDTEKNAKTKMKTTNKTREECDAVEPK